MRFHGLRFQAFLLLGFLAHGSLEAQPAADDLRRYTTGVIKLKPPEYLPAEAKIAHQARFLHRIGELSELLTPGLTGEGITVAVWDGGLVRASHPDFGAGQVRGDKDPAYQGLILNNHATHVAGTIGGSGRGRPEARGMAPGATIWSLDYNNDLAEMKALADGGTAVNVSNHSYGYEAGWSDICPEENPGHQERVRWVWVGPKSAGEDPLFGRYEKTSAQLDALARNHPTWTQVVAAGNERAPVLDPHNAARELASLEGYDWVTKYDLSFDGSHRLDGCKGKMASEHHPSDRAHGGGFDTIPGGNGVAKNVITVGAMADPVDAWDPVLSVFKPARLIDIRTTSFSSWGPTDDGRIKPDVIANGDVLIATAIPPICLEAPGCKPADVKSEDAHYVRMSGSSMAAPVVSGALALLNELSMRTRQRLLRSDEVKAMLIHTALSPNEGPTYQMGWGSIQADEAGLLLLGRVPGDHLMLETVPRSTVRKIRLRRVGTRNGRVTLAWLDPPGTPSNVSDAKPSLVHDLDAQLVPPSEAISRTPEIGPVLPWTLDPENPSQAARRGRNSRDNVERIDVPNDRDAPGEWMLEIRAADWADTGAQDVAVAIWGFDIIHD
jgi:subtilisin family serine protease